MALVGYETRAVGAALFSSFIASSAEMSACEKNGFRVEDEAAVVQAYSSIGLF